MLGRHPRKKSDHHEVVHARAQSFHKKYAFCNYLHSEYKDFWSVNATLHSKFVLSLLRRRSELVTQQFLPHQRGIVAWRAQSVCANTNTSFLLPACRLLPSPTPPRPVPGCSPLATRADELTNPFQGGGEGRVCYAVWFTWLPGACLVLSIAVGNFQHFLRAGYFLARFPPDAASILLYFVDLLPFIEKHRPNSCTGRRNRAGQPGFDSRPWARAHFISSAAGKQAQARTICSWFFCFSVFLFVVFLFFCQPQLYLWIAAFPLFAQILFENRLSSTNLKQYRNKRCYDYRWSLRKPSTNTEFTRKSMLKTQLI